MDIATQTLHRLTSFTRAWYKPIRENDDLIGKRDEWGQEALGFEFEGDLWYL